VNAAALRDPWFSVPIPKPAAGTRLFCLPYAGGGASVYFAWSRALREQPIEVLAVQPPGRENRLRDTPCDDLDRLVSSLADAIAPLVDRPYGLFGHSMGALVAFELTRVLRDRGARLPERLFVSGAHAPQVARDEEPLRSIVDDAAFVEAVASRYGGIPQIVLENAELRGVIVPALRADLAVTETYAYREAPPLPCPIAAYGGSSDPMVREDRLERWREQTTGEFSCRLFDGDHFFLNGARDALLSDVTARLPRSI
jgi:surfactin synthase thioesterase subunit